MDPFWIANVKLAVELLHDAYHHHRGLLLTEGDLECQLFWFLSRVEPFRGYRGTQPNGEGPSSGYIHSQVTWLPHYRRKFFPDLTVLNPEYLYVDSFQNPDIPVELRPYKGFYHDSSAIGIEIKFIRHSTNIVARAREDFIHIVNNLIPAVNDKNGVNQQRAFFSVVGCKNKQYYDQAVKSLNTFIEQHPQIPPNVYVCAFHQDEICWFPNA